MIEQEEVINTYNKKSASVKGVPKINLDIVKEKEPLDETGQLDTKRLMQGSEHNKKEEPISEGKFEVNHNHLNAFIFRGSVSKSRIRSPKKKIIQISDLIIQDIKIIETGNSHENENKDRNSDFGRKPPSIEQEYKEFYKKNEFKDINRDADVEEKSTSQKCCSLFC